MGAAVLWACQGCGQEWPGQVLRCQRCHTGPVDQQQEASMPKISRDVGPTFAGVTTAPSEVQYAAAKEREGTEEFTAADARVLELRDRDETAQGQKDEDKADRRRQRREADPDTEGGERSSRGSSSRGSTARQQTQPGQSEDAPRRPAPTTGSPSAKDPEAGSGTARSTAGSGPGTPQSAASKAK